ncbi:MAG: hypothetical protein JWM46_912 [Candidatus Kaiserbacteria bacterium]|nr:hypothetical protein [Candidatus Kaiserbacteria bacterium]
MATSSLIVLNELLGNQPTHLNAIQVFFLPYEHLLSLFWILIWCITAGVVLTHLAQEYRNRHDQR